MYLHIPPVDDLSPSLPIHTHVMKARSISPPYQLRFSNRYNVFQVIKSINLDHLSIARFPLAPDLYENDLYNLTGLPCT